MGRRLVLLPLPQPPPRQPSLPQPPGHPAPTAAALPVAAGVLLPRAPRRFALRHRDGTTRLATLSYLTADPAHGAVAYGLSLPEPAGPERLGLVYALARVLEAFESTDPVVGHGDLSSKNVLWSLQRGPEVFVIDCDNCERFDPDGRPLAEAGRRRATTPNWEDPAVLAGANPYPGIRPVLPGADLSARGWCRELSDSGPAAARRADHGRFPRAARTVRGGSARRRTPRCGSCAGAG